jgi:hypothetical protein
MLFTLPRENNETRWRGIAKDDSGFSLALLPDYATLHPLAI